jgi:hypothetical protein
VRRASALVLAVGLLSVVASHASADSRSDGVRRAVEYLVAAQESNGAFFRANEAAEETAAVVGALVAGGAESRNVDRALDYIGATGRSRTTRGAYTGRIVAGIVAGGRSPTDLNGYDYLAKLQSQYNADTGAFDEKFFGHLEAVNGLLAAKQKVPDKAIGWIRSNACSGGGFGDDAGCPNGANVDSTAWAIDVLVGSGRKTDPLVTQSRAFLLSVQHTDGGFGFTQDLSTSSDSTGLALSAIAALGEDARAGAWRQTDGDDPVGALLALQTKEGGFKFVASSKATGRATINALPGLAGVAYPVAAATPAPPTARPTSTPQASSKPKSTEKPASVAGTTTATGTAGPAVAVPSAAAGIDGSVTPIPMASAAPQVGEGEAAPFGVPAEESSDDRELFPSILVGLVAGGVAIGAGFGAYRLRARLKR